MTAHRSHFQTKYLSVCQCFVTNICVGKFFTLTQNSRSCGFLLKILDLVHKSSPNNIKCVRTLKEPKGPPNKSITLFHEYSLVIRVTGMNQKLMNIKVAAFY